MNFSTKPIVGLAVGAGLLVAAPMVTAQSGGSVNTDTTIGSDVYSTIRNGTKVDLRALAALRVGGQSRFYRIDLPQGRAAFRGTFRRSTR